MKKRTIAILAPIVVVVLALQAIALQFALMPSSGGVLFVLSRACLLDREEWKGVFIQLEEENDIAPSGQANGKELSAFGYTLRVNSEDGYEEKISDADFVTFVAPEKEKVVSLRNSYGSDRTLKLADNPVSDGTYWSICNYDDRMVDAYHSLGIAIDTEYDCYTAPLRVTPLDYSLYDNNRNALVSQLLVMKQIKCGIFGSIHEFNNGNAKGIVLSDERSHLIEFCSVDDCSKVYSIVLAGDFNEAEVDAIICTIRVDEEDI